MRLFPLRSFPVGYMKGKYYVENPTTEEELITSIKNVIYDITIDMLEKVFYSFRKRIDFCARSNGLHLESSSH